MNSKRRLWIGFSGLCLLAGSGWILDQGWPAMLSGLQRTALHTLLLAVAFGLGGSGGWKSVARRRLLQIVVAAALMFGVPDVVFAGAAGHVSQELVVLALMLVPVVVILAVAQHSAGFGQEEGPLAGIIPALVALGGAALLIPLDLPASVAGRLWLLAIVASIVPASVAAVRMHTLLAGVGILPGAALVAVVSAASAAAFWNVGSVGPITFTWGGALVEASRCLLFDGPILLLTVWLVREMEPVAASVRFLLIPLVTIVESFIAIRPDLTWTSLAAVIFMAGGGIWLLARGAGEPTRTPLDSGL